MNGIKFIDNELKVNRPKSYNGPPDSKVASWKALLQTSMRDWLFGVRVPFSRR